MVPEVDFVGLRIQAICIGEKTITPLGTFPEDHQILEHSLVVNLLGDYMGISCIDDSLN